VPVWAYFHSALPSLSSMAIFLCNSLPTLVPIDRVLVTLRGLTSPLELVLSDDRVAAADRAHVHEVSTVPNGFVVCAEGQWGCVRSGRAGGVSVMIASFANDTGDIVATRGGTYSRQEELRFTSLTWHTAHAIRVLEEASADVPVRESRTLEGLDA
jgi:hypothetical protein